MTDSTNDAVPLTPLVVDVVTFDRAPLGRRGYHEDQVDEYLDRIQATLAGTDNLTAQEVREVVFDAAPLIRRGYHEDQVDDFLDLVVAELDARERNRSARAAAQRQRTPRPATRGAAPPAGAAEQTSPVLPKLPAEQPRGTASNPSFPPAAGPGTPGTSSSLPAASPGHAQPRATASNPSFPPASGSFTAAAPAHTADPTARHTQPPADSGASFPPASGAFPVAPNPSPAQDSASRHAQPPAADSGGSTSPDSGPAASIPAVSGPGASFPPDSGRGASTSPDSGSRPSASNPSFRPVAGQPPATPGRGPLALPLPPTPPDERGYHPADVARLVALLREPGEPPSSAAITGMRLNRMDVGQGYHAGAVDAMRAIWITELRRRGL